MKDKFGINFLEIFWVSLAFIFFTMVGALSHEYGHIAVAKYYGFPTILHYGSMNYEDNSVEMKEADLLMKKNNSAIVNQNDFPDQDQLNNLWKVIYFKELMIRIGGPFQTILTGTIGFIVLLIRRKNIQQYGMKTLDWLCVFLSLFWLREVCNLTLSVLSAILRGKQNYFGGDEKNIAMMLEIPKGSIAIPLAILGLLVSLFVIFKIIPIDKRLNFILGGLFGGVLGYILWLRILGPIVMP